MRLLLLVLASVACIAAANPSRKVKAVSTDGEATIYVMGNFSRGFNVAYNATLRTAPGNRANTFIGIMLIGRQNPGPGIELGLTRGAGNAHDLRVFISVNPRHGENIYTSFPAACVPACELILRGDRYGLYAFVLTEDGIRKAGTWSRADFGFVRPYVQLNGEVTRPGDGIVGALMPMRAVVDSKSLPAPTCAFTTRGIEPRRDPGGTLTFSGTFANAAPASFIDLRNGSTVNRCPR
jgi:hypothetical protein